jgi:hypothetical protein
MKGVLALAAILFFAFKIIASMTAPKTNLTTEIDDGDGSPKTSKTKRRPASQRSLVSQALDQIGMSSTTPQGATYQVTERPYEAAPDEGGVESVTPESAATEPSAPMVADTSNPGYMYGRPTSGQPSTSPSSPSANKQFSPSSIGQTSSSSSSIISGTGSILPPAATLPLPTVTPPAETSSQINFSCDSSLGSGTYQYPTTTSLSCSTTAKIKYCLQEDTCCDPQSDGAKYTTAIPVGSKAKTYCLSFYGTIGSSTSPVVHKTFTFNPQAPNLTAIHEKRFYQTTQLHGLSVLSSTKFGSADYTVGQVNTRAIDPGPSGLDLSCPALIESFTSMTPLPIETFAPVSMSGFTPTEQIEIFLQVPRLVYGSNFITSYAVHANYVERAACSTTNITLKDFDYFEMSANLSPYGFFEADVTQLNRGPAGSSLEAIDGQELRSGLFSVFY